MTKERRKETWGVSARRHADQLDKQTAEQTRTDVVFTTPANSLLHFIFVRLDHSFKMIF